MLIYVKCPSAYICYRAFETSKMMKIEGLNFFTEETLVNISLADFQACKNLTHFVMNSSY